MHKLVAASGLAALAAGCAATAPFSPETQTGAARDAVVPDRACPVPGQTYRSGDASAKASAAQTYAGGTYRGKWTVTFSKQTSPNPPVTYASQVVACAPPPRKRPKGSVSVTGHSVRSHCTNNVCTIEVTEDYTYVAPATLRKPPWKYDVVRFVPAKPKPPYGPLPAVRLTVVAP